MIELDHMALVNKVWDMEKIIDNQAEIIDRQARTIADKSRELRFVKDNAKQS